MANKQSPTSIRFPSLTAAAAALVAVLGGSMTPGCGDDSSGTGGGSSTTGTSGSGTTSSTTSSTTTTTTTTTTSSTTTTTSSGGGGGAGGGGGSAGEGGAGGASSAVCGDSDRTGAEQCDDGNTAAGDGCSATCTLEGNYTNEVEPNDTSAQATALAAGFSGVGAIGVPADRDFYSFDVAAGSSVTLEISDGNGGCPNGFDSKVFLHAPDGTLLAEDDDGGVPPCSLLGPTTSPEAGNLAAGTYTAEVTHFADGEVTPFYVLSVTVTPPACGDGIVQTGETCDDANTVTGDGCSATCATESSPETEPNNTQATATPKRAAFSFWTGDITPAGDEDWYSFQVPANGSVTLETHDAGTAGCSAETDTVVALVNSAGVELVSDDDGGVAPCSSISPAAYTEAANLAAGTYYAHVTAYDDTLTFTGYQLNITITP